MTSRMTYWQRLIEALLGREAPAAARPESPADAAPAELRARIASLELDLRERDQRIEQMKAEYAHLQGLKEKVSEASGRQQIERLFQKLAGPLSNLVALTAMAEAGKDVAATDLAQLIRGAEAELARAGLEPVGRVGEQVPFQPGRHQRMSGGAVRDGLAVTVQIPGYVFGERVLRKAMVTAKEDPDG